MRKIKAIRFLATSLACGLAFCIAARANYAATMTIGFSFSACWIVLAAHARDKLLLVNNLVIVSAYIVGIAVK